MIDINHETQYSQKKKVLMYEGKDIELICTPNNRLSAKFMSK